MGLAAGLFDQPVNLAESKAGAPPELLRRKKWVKSVETYTSRTSPAPVSETAIITRSPANPVVMRRHARLHIGSADRDQSTVRHGVSCVDDKIKDRMLQLCDIHECRNGRAIQVQLEAGVAAERCYQQCLHPLQDLVHIGSALA